MADINEDMKDLMEELNGGETENQNVDDYLRQVQDEVRMRNPAMAGPMNIGPNFDQNLENLHR